VIPSNSGLETEVLTEVAAHALGEQFFPSVTILGQGGIGIGLFESGNMVFLLLLTVVNTGGRSIKKPFNARLFGRHAQMRIDQHGDHAQSLIVLDEAHASHVCG